MKLLDHPAGFATAVFVFFILAMMVLWVFETRGVIPADYWADVTCYSEDGSVIIDRTYKTDTHGRFWDVETGNEISLSEMDNCIYEYWETFND